MASWPEQGPRETEHGGPHPWGGGGAATSSEGPFSRTEFTTSWLAGHLHNSAHPAQYGPPLLVKGLAHPRPGPQGPLRAHKVPKLGSCYVPAPGRWHQVLSPPLQTESALVQGCTEWGSPTLFSHPGSPLALIHPAHSADFKISRPSKFLPSSSSLRAQARLVVLMGSGESISRRAETLRVRILALPNQGLGSPQEPHAPQAYSAGLGWAQRVGNEYESHPPAADGSSPAGSRNIKLLGTGHQRPAQVPPPPLEGARGRSQAPRQRTMGPRDSRMRRGHIGGQGLQPGAAEGPWHWPRRTHAGPTKSGRHCPAEPGSRNKGTCSCPSPPTATPAHAAQRGHPYPPTKLLISPISARLTYSHLPGKLLA